MNQTSMRRHKAYTQSCVEWDDFNPLDLLLLLRKVRHLFRLSVQYESFHAMLSH
jgi:hypothetical protein